MYKIVSFFFTAIAAFSIVACSNQNNGQERPKSAPLAVEYLPIKYEVFSSNYITNGEVMPFEEVNIRSEVTGRVQSIHFREGDKVQKGQRIFSLDARDLQADLKKNEVLLKQAKVDVERRKTLLENKAISQEEFDQFVNRYEEYQATEAQLLARIDAYHIRAPFDGVLGLRYVSEGSMVSVGELLSVLAMQSPLKLEFSVPERYAQIVNVGDSVLFTLRNSLDTLRAKVYARDSRIQADARALRVRAEFENKKDQIIPGGFARVIYPLEIRENAILIPTDAIVAQSDGEFVVKIVDGVAKVTKIQTIERTSTRALVITGLQEGDTIALSGLLYLRDGSPVKIKEN
jgi:membrane fusion protein (multidrug efflux system)